MRQVKHPLLYTKSADASRGPTKNLEPVGPDCLKNFHSDEAFFQRQRKVWDP
jgi:hypothetical protein